MSTLTLQLSQRDTRRSSSMASSPAEEELDFPRLPSGALDRSRICLKQKQAYEQCHGGSFLDMLKRMGDSLAGGSMEAKCQDEGGHLLHILSQGVQTGVQELIQKKKQLKDFFEDDKWSTGLSSSNEKYWIGGMVSL